MICKRCGNTKRFTMIKDILYWDAEKKIFERILNGEEHYVCDDCMINNEEGKHIDTEGDY